MFKIMRCLIHWCKGGFAPKLNSFSDIFMIYVYICCDNIILARHKQPPEPIHPERNVHTITASSYSVEDMLYGETDLIFPDLASVVLSAEAPVRALRCTETPSPNCLFLSQKEAWEPGQSNSEMKKRWINEGRSDEKKKKKEVEKRWWCREIADNGL